MSSSLTIESLVDDFRRLGVSQGDTLWVRADLASIVSSAAEAPLVIEALLSAVGAEGTVIVPAFTRVFPSWRLDKNHVFDKNTPAATGALSRMMLRHRQAVRSTHPACSIVAIGRHAADICSRHDESAPAYGFIRDLLDLNGRMLLLGCVCSSPGFTTVHYVQNELNLAGRSLMKNRWQVYYRKDGLVHLYKRPDPGGDSKGFWRFYAYYVQAGKLLTGTVGGAYSASIKAADAYEIEHRLLEENPRLALCGDPCCIECMCTWTYNLRGIPKFLVARLLTALHLMRRA